jgi:hypothetical protein
MIDIGKPTCDEYLYSIMGLAMKDWSEEQIASYWWDDFCDGSLENLASVVAGAQGNPTISLDQDDVPLKQGDTVFVFGRTVEGARKLARLYQIIHIKQEHTWSEITRGILSAIAAWQLKTSEPFFRAFIIALTANWSASELASLLSYLSSYATSIKESKWETWEPSTEKLFREITSSWDYAKKSTFLNIVETMWDWSREGVQKMKETILTPEELSQMQLHEP